MISVDAMAAAYRVGLLGDGTLAGYLPGGIAYERQREGASSTGYAVLKVSKVAERPSSGFIYRTFQMTVAMYLPSDGANQSSAETRLRTLVDYQRTFVSPSGGAINMVTPTTAEMSVAEEMRRGADVAPVICAWMIHTVEART